MKIVHEINTFTPCDQSKRNKIRHNESQHTSSTGIVNQNYLFQ